MPSVKAIILRKKPFNEGDLIVESLGALGERHTFIAKNARQSRRRFSGGVLDPLQFVELYYTQRNSGFDFLHEGKVLYGFAELRKSYEKIQMGLYFLKLSLMVTRDGMDENKLLFDLLGNTLRTLEKAENLQLLKAHYEVKFLFYLGFYFPVDEMKVFTNLPVSHHHKIPMSAEQVQKLLRHTKKYIERVKNL